MAINDSGADDGGECLLLILYMRIPHLVLLYCCSSQWHTIDFVMHSNQPACRSYNGAILDIFKHCGKEIQKTFKSERNERNVSLDKMKKWLMEIRERARSK